MAPQVSADELRSFLQIPYIPTDAADLAIAGVEGLVRGYTGRAWAAVDDAVFDLDGTGGRSLLLPKLPVRDVLEVLQNPDAADGWLSGPLELGTQVEWSSDGIVRRIDGGIFARRLRYYRISCKHGEVFPDEVKLVVLRVCARAAVNPEGLTQEAAGSSSGAFGFDASRLATLSDPDKADLDPFRVTV